MWRCPGRWWPRNPGQAIAMTRHPTNWATPQRTAAPAGRAVRRTAGAAGHGLDRRPARPAGPVREWPTGKAPSDAGPVGVRRLSRRTGLVPAAHVPLTRLRAGTQTLVPAGRATLGSCLGTGQVGRTPDLCSRGARRRDRVRPGFTRNRRWPGTSANSTGPVRPVGRDSSQDCRGRLRCAPARQLIADAPADVLFSEGGSPGEVPPSWRVCHLTPVLGPDHMRDVIGEALRHVKQPHQAGGRELVA